MKLEDLQPNVAVRGILPEALVTVVNVQWYGDNALELTYKDPAGRVSNEVLSLLKRGQDRDHRIACESRDQFTSGISY
jgi:hypothetical protein